MWCSISLGSLLFSTDRLRVTLLRNCYDESPSDVTINTPCDSDVTVIWRRSHHERCIVITQQITSQWSQMVILRWTKSGDCIMTSRWPLFCDTSPDNFLFTNPSENKYHGGFKAEPPMANAWDSHKKQNNCETFLFISLTVALLIIFDVKETLCGVAVILG